MKAKDPRPKEKGHSAKFGPLAEFVTCPSCGHEIALWTEGDAVTRCTYCGRKFFRGEATVH